MEANTQWIHPSRCQVSLPPFSPWQISLICAIMKNFCPYADDVPAHCCVMQITVPLRALRVLMWPLLNGNDDVDDVPHVLCHRDGFVMSIVVHRMPLKLVSYLILAISFAQLQLDRCDSMWIPLLAMANKKIWSMKTLNSLDAQWMYIYTVACHSNGPPATTQLPESLLHRNIPIRRLLIMRHVS